MPLPWKKVRRSRISQLVNDHLQKSQRRRGDSTLMVETGFPTSLVDLFIKNREKLKKPSKKKREKSPPVQLDDRVVPRSSPSNMASTFLDPSGVASPSLDSSSFCSLSLDLPPLALPLNSPPVLASSSRSTGGEDGGNGLKSGVDASPLNSRSVLALSPLSTGGKDGRNGLKSDMAANRIFLAIVKMLLVVALAFGAKKFALGFTMSAFLLFFVDYVGKRAIVFLKPSAEAQKGLRSVIQRVWKISSSQEDLVVWKKDGLLKSEIQQVEGLNSGYELNDTIQEPQFVEVSYLPRVQEIQCEDEIIEDPVSSDGKLGYEEWDSKMVVMEKQEMMSEFSEPEKRRSRKIKMSLKMKKYIPKKFQRRKEHSESGETSPVKEDTVAILEEHVAHEYMEAKDLASLNSLSSLSIERYERRNSIAAINCTNRSLEGCVEATPNQGDDRIERGQSWRYFLLCLIVLIGLTGGRIFALFLTLFWCLLLKSRETLPRYIKVPRIWSSANMPR